MTTGSIPQPTPSNGTRRSFLNMAIGTLGAVFSASLAYSLFRFLWPRAGRTGGEGRVGIPMEEMLAGQSRIVLVGGEPVLVIREANRTVALSATCTHMRCIVHYRGAGVIVCPCHASAFDLSGNVTSGPAPRPLPSYPVRIEGNRIVVGS